LTGAFRLPRRRTSGPVRADVARLARTAAVLTFFIASLFLASALAPAEETVFGGTASFTVGVTGSWLSPSALSPLAEVGLDPSLTVFGDTGELRASGSLERVFPGASVTGAIDTLELRLFPADWLALDIGLGRHLPGAAILLSPVNYLMPVVLDLGRGGELPSTAGSAALFSATFFLQSSYIGLHVAPAPTAVSLPEIDDDILSTLPFLMELSDADASGPLSRASLAIAETQELTALQRVSVGLEAGGAIGPVDLTVLYYHGLDRIPTVLGTVDTVSLPAGEFALSLAPAESVIDALGISAQTAAGPAMFWLDGSYVFRREFGTTDIVTTESAGVYRTDTVRVSHLELVAGGLLRLSRPQLSLAAEYRHAFLGTDRTDIIRLDFPGTALLSLTSDFADGLVSSTVAGLVLIPDRSAIVTGSVTVSPSSELSAFLQVPVVAAGSDSLLVGLRSRLPITAGVAYRF